MSGNEGHLRGMQRPHCLYLAAKLVDLGAQKSMALAPGLGRGGQGRAHTHTKKGRGWRTYTHIHIENHTYIRIYDCHRADSGHMEMVTVI